MPRVAAWMREPNHADIDGLFCRRGNRDRGSRRRSRRRLSGGEHRPPARASGFQAGTQDVGGADPGFGGARGTARRLSTLPTQRQQPQTQQAQPQHRSQPQAAAPSTATQAPLQPPIVRSRREARQYRSGRAARTGTAATCKLTDPPNRPTKKPPRRATPSRKPARPTSNARTPKSGAPNGASAGPKSAASSSRASRNSRRSRQSVREVTEPRRIRIGKKASPRRIVRRTGEKRHAADQAVRSGRLISVAPIAIRSGA